MDNQDRKLTELNKYLKSGEVDKIINRLRKLRDQKSIPGALLLLREIYEEQNDPRVQTEVERFFNDLKDQKLTDEVLEAIDISNKDITKQKLISSCWQSGLDYSAHIQRFIEYSIEYSYLVTLECYSVIEEWATTAGSDERNTWKKMLNDSLLNQPEDKKKLIEAIISIL